MRGTIQTTMPSGAAAPNTAVPAGQYDLSLIDTGRTRYRTNLASFAANLTAAFAALGIRAQVVANSPAMSQDDITTTPSDPTLLARWSARVNVVAPTTQTLLHRAMARAAWHSSTWDIFNVGGVNDGTWTTPAKNAADGGASFVSSMDFGIEEAGQGTAGSNAPGGSATEQAAARNLDALAQRVALLNGAGVPIVNAEVRRLQLAMGMESATADGRYTDDTRARMRYLGIASPSPSFRAGSSAPAPNTTTAHGAPNGTGSNALAYVLAAGGVSLVGWLLLRKKG